VSETALGNGEALWRRAALASLPHRRREEGPRQQAWGLEGVPRPDARTLARWVDHTLLRPDATEADVRRVCQEARRWGCASACVNARFVPAAHEELAGSTTVVCAVVGFPLGAMPSAAKAFEASWAVQHGAREIDMVLALGELKAGNDHAVWADVRAVREAAGESTVLKVILETALLTDEEKVLAAAIAVAAGADFVKTSTGFGPGGAKVEDVRLLRQAVGHGVGVKASGGIGTYEEACALLAAGADRLGMSRTLAVLAQAPSASGERTTPRDGAGT
jgi:deoxyribose-phosphate aldolase